MHALDPWFVIVGPLYYFGHNFLNFEPISMKLGDIETSFQALSNKHIHSTTNNIIFPRYSSVKFILVPTIIPLIDRSCEYSEENILKVK